MKFSLPEVLLIVAATIVATLLHRIDITLVLIASLWTGIGTLRRHQQRRPRQPRL
jgi:hypothetical protein